MRFAWRDAPSIRTRLVLAPTAILLLGLVFSIGYILSGARDRVQAEVQTGMRVGHLLVRGGLRAVAEASNPVAAFAQFARDLPQVRHVQFAIIPPGGSMSAGIAPQITAEAPEPRWFARLLAPPPSIELFPVVIGARVEGAVAMRSNPADEIGEIWRELLLLTGVLAGIWVLIIAMLYAIVTLSLRPIRTLGDAFDRLERGRFDPLPPVRVAELRRIFVQFNSLANSLEQVRRDNHLLIDRMMSMQEQERKELGRELHDEIGPSLFGIRTDAACIQRDAARLGAAGTAIAERADSIADLADTVQRINYRMLERLRPLILEEMGLPEALRQLVLAWQARYPQIACTFATLDSIALDELTGLALFRVVQECLTNVARHAGASAVQLSIAELADSIRVRVQDNGSGLPPDFRMGFGLLGMTERVRQLDGQLSVRSPPEGGTLIELTIPRKEAA